MARISHSRTPVPTAGRLNAETVVDAALELIARRGLEGLSMRALGEALGVEAMSLYHWFPAKERLVDAIADRLIRTVKLPPAPNPAGWKRWMTTVAQDYRRMGRAHPRAFPLIGGRRFLSPGAAIFVQAIVSANLAAGFGLRESVRLTRSIGAFVNGAMMLEIATPALLQPLDVDTAGQRLPERQWREVMTIITGRPALDGAFDYGLACLLDGALHSLRERGAHPAKRKTSRRVPRI